MAYEPLQSQMTDEQLVERCRTGDQDAFGELVYRHQSAALKIAVSIVRNRHDAEDEVQNSFWKAYEHLEQFHSEAKFSTWLTRIVVNQCLMRLRQVKRVQFAYVDNAGNQEGSIPFEFKDPGRSPEDQLGSSEVGTVFWNELRRTPPLLRSVFVKRDVEELPIETVAAELGISVPAAKSRLLRARAELRSRMKKHCAESGAATLLASR